MNVILNNNNNEKLSKMSLFSCQTANGALTGLTTVNVDDDAALHYIQEKKCTFYNFDRLINFCAFHL